MTASTTFRRLLQAVPVLLGVSVLTFLLLNLLPGNVALVILGPGATPKQIRVVERQDGLTQPLWDRYWHWLTQALQGNLGTSLISHEGVTSLVFHAVPVTLEVILVAQIVALIFAVLFASLAVLVRRRWFDRLLGLIAFGGISAPPFLFGIVLILLVAVDLHWLPATGWVPLTQSLSGNLKTVILPAATLAIGEFAVHMRILRGDMLEQMRENYVTTARAKGLPQSRIVLVHVLRNSLFVLITVVGVNIGKLLSGAVIVEVLFALPGVGNMLINAITQRDVPLVQGIVVFVAFAFVVINLAVDIIYAALDPRIRRSSSNG
jgi:peptide/nickel transport system permease protein